MAAERTTTCYSPLAAYFLYQFQSNAWFARSELLLYIENELNRVHEGMSTAQSTLGISIEVLVIRGTRLYVISM